MEAEVAQEIDAAVAFAEAGHLGAGRGPRALRVLGGRTMTITTTTAPTVRLTYREAMRAAPSATPSSATTACSSWARTSVATAAASPSRKGLLDEFGPDRIRDTPLSESAFVGAGIGAAMAGMRPIVEIMTVNFSLLALDQIMNNAATLQHMSGGQLHVPLVIRMTTGAGRQLAAQHSHSLEGWYAHIPGIKVLAPATVEDARGMLWPALEDPDPGPHLRARRPLQRRGASCRRCRPRWTSSRAAVRRSRGRRLDHHLRRLAPEVPDRRRGAGRARASTPR